MLDRLSPAWRHFLIGLLVAVLTVAGTWIPQLGLHPALSALGAAVVGYLLLWATPLTRQYGVGAGGE